MADSAAHVEGEVAAVEESAQQVEAGVPLVKGAPRQKFSIEVLQDIKKAQQEHGLRYDDYQRYRQYCSRRLARIRKSLKFVNTVKGKYHKREISANNMSDERYLLLSLVQAERAWSYAMQIRQDNSEEGAARPRHHLIRRLRKAVQHAKRFDALCTERGDKRTSLEAGAYHSWMVGNISVEIEDWKTALEHFSTIRTVYESLQQLPQSNKELLQARIDEAEPFIRFCQRNIARTGGAAAGDSDMMDLEMAPGSGAARDMLKAKLDSVLKETRKHQAKSLANVSWLGKTVTMGGDALRQAWVTGQDTSFRLSKATALSEKMDLFDKTLIAYNDALDILRRDVEGMSKEDSALARAYVQHQILRTTMSRHLVLVEEYDSRLQRGENTLEGRPVTAIDLANIYDRLQGDLDDLSRLPVASADEGTQREVAARGLLFRAARTMWIGESYAAAHNYAEACALVGKARSIADAAQARLTQIPELRADNERCAALHSKCTGRLCILRAEAAEQKAAPRPAESAAAAADKATAASAPLLSRLESYEAAASAGTAPVLAEFPPGMEAVPAKPILFDLAWNSMQCPDLSDRVSKKKGGMLGWLRR